MATTSSTGGRFVDWLLVIPQFIVLWVLSIVAGIVWFISFFTVLFTRKNPLFAVQTMILRYNWRVLSFFYFLRNEYPPFDFRDDSPGAEIPDAAVVDIEDPRGDEPMVATGEVVVGDPALCRARGSSGSVCWVVHLVMFFVLCSSPGSGLKASASSSSGTRARQHGVNAYILLIHRRSIRRSACSRPRLTARRLSKHIAAQGAVHVRPGR